MYPDAIGYKTEAGAGKKLRQHGFANVKEAFAAKFSEIPVALAQRGDIGVIDRDGVLSGGVPLVGHYNEPVSRSSFKLRFM